MITARHSQLKIPLPSLFLLLVFAVAAPLAAKALKKIVVIELPGPMGRQFGALAIDPEQNLLFVAHSGAGMLYAIDLKTNKVIKVVEGLPGARSVTFAADLRKIYVADAGDNSIAVLDLDSMEVLKRIPAEAKPGGLAYAAPFKKIYVSNELARSVAVVDANRDAVVKMLRFEGEAGDAVYDPAAEKVYVNLQQANRLAVIDPKTDQILGSYSVGKCQGNHGLALDSEAHRAFLSCQQNNLLAVFDLDKNQTISFLPLEPGADVVAFDAALHRIYTACASGEISIFEEKDASVYRKLGEIPVAHGVHSLAVDSATHRVYAPEMEEDGAPAARLMVFEAAQK
jgi:YVTN family beta-propeller protein